VALTDTFTSTNLPFGGQMADGVAEIDVITGAVVSDGTTTAVAAWLGTVCFRTHDVRATRRVVDMVAGIRGERPPLVSRRGVRP